MVHGYKVFWHIRSVCGWPQSLILILASNPDIRSDCLYGQFSFDKTWTLQAGSSVFTQFPMTYYSPIPPATKMLVSLMMTTHAL